MDRHHHRIPAETDAAVSKLASQCWLSRARLRRRSPYLQHQAYQTGYWLYSELRAPKWHCHCLKLIISRSSSLANLCHLYRPSIFIFSKLSLIFISLDLFSLRKLIYFAIFFK